MLDQALYTERRCHFASVIISTLKATWMIIVVLLVNFFRQIQQAAAAGIPSFMLLLSGAALVLVLGAIFLIYTLRWRRTYVYFSGHDFIVERRLAISQSKTTLRPETVASINVQQSLLERVFRVSRLQFDINSAANADETDFDLVFDTETALAIKREMERLRALVGEGIAAEDNTAAAPALTVLRRFSGWEVARHALLGTPLWGIVYTLISVPLLLATMLDDVSGRSLNLGTLFSILIAVGPMLSQTVSPFFRYYGFTLARQGADRVVISCGLLTKRQFTLPLEKTNAIVLRQPFLSRAFGLAYGEIINVGMGDVEEGISPAFCLITNVREMNELLYHVAPQFIIDCDIIASPRPALPLQLLRNAVPGAVVLAVSSCFGLWWAGLLFLLLLLVCAWASWRTKGLSLMHDRLAITTGIFAKRTIVTFYARLQNLRMASGPLARRRGLAHGAVTILSGVVNRNNSIGYFPTTAFSIIAGEMLRFDSTGETRQGINT